MVADSVAAVIVTGTSPAVIFYVLFGTVLRTPLYLLMIGLAALASGRTTLFVALIAAIATVAAVYGVEWRNYQPATASKEWMLANSAYLIATSMAWAWWFSHRVSAKTRVNVERTT
jgi:hypothetical protein